MTPVPAKTRKLFQFFLIVTNGHLPHFCPTFNMAALLPKRSAGTTVAANEKLRIRGRAFTRQNLPGKNRY